MPPQRVETSDGISWHVETFPPQNKVSGGAAEGHIVLIPSGEGDCHNLTQLAQLLSSAGPYHIVTFDTPGFSRTTAPAKAYARVTPDLLAGQTLGLLDQLKIPRATFFGCSSGACTTLALCALHPSRVKCGIVHEAPLEKSEQLLEMLKLSDEEISAACEGLYAKGLVEQDVNNGAQKWDALGPEYHARLAKNYVPWVRGYVNAIEVGGEELVSDPENLKRRPIFWTVGALNPGAAEGQGVWRSNFEAAKRAGLEVDVQRLNSMHFPAVTVPEDLAGWIVESIGKVKD